MRNHNARNERIKRKYYTWLKEARGQSEATIDQVSSSIDALTRMPSTPISRAFTLRRSFFEWLSGQPGYKQSFAFGDWDYFTPTGATASIARRAGQCVRPLSLRFGG
jgi:hypothetical protein